MSVHEVVGRWQRHHLQAAVESDRRTVQETLAALRRELEQAQDRSRLLERELEELKQSAGARLPAPDRLEDLE